MNKLPGRSTSIVIAFDFGRKSIGVAVGEKSLATANELTPLKANNGVPDWEVIGALIDEWEPGAVLVGLPLNMDGSDQDMTRRARKFARRIQGRFRHLHVQMVDERLSTREAKTIAHERGHSGNYAKQPLDSISARLLLESWWAEQ